FASALLVASVIAATDPATLIPILHGLDIRRHLKQAIIAESALDDATGAILTFTVLPIALGTSLTGVSLVPTFLWQVAISLGIGILGGLIAGRLIAEGGWLQAYSGLLLLGLVILSYAMADRLGGSGFMAAFAAGVMVGNVQYSGFPTGVSTQERTSHFLD